MKKILIAASLILSVNAVSAQKYFTRTGNISFFSHTPMEDIKAVNNEVSSVLDATTGEVRFIVPINSFKFQNALMQEHFNENYMESTKFPKAEFKGTVSNISAAQLSKNGTYNTTVTGKLTMHGVTKEVSVPSTIIVKDGSVTANTKFTVQTADYSIKVPTEKVAKSIEITVSSILAPAKK